MEPLIVSRYTALTCLGAGRAALANALREGRSALKPCDFETAEIETYIGEVEGLTDVALTGNLASFDCRNNRLAQLALQQDGFADWIGAARERYGARRIAVVLGTSTSGIHATELAYRARDADGVLPADFDYHHTHNAFSLARYVAHALGLTGPATVLSAACATTAKAFASAARMISAGLCDAALVGGADSLTLTTLYGFRALELTSPEICRPYDAGRKGISIGEGAGFALLERADAGSADAIRVLGVGESCDAYHMSTPHPEGVGARLAMERALSSASLKPADIGYINLHGTATKVGDASEDKAVVSLFGEGVPCSSTKGVTGHTLGAAGIVEGIITMIALEEEFLPGSPTTLNKDEALHTNYLIEGRGEGVRHAMSNSFGFGGTNCSLIFGRA